MELWDAYDDKFNKIEGMTLVRGQPLPMGVYHLVCDVAVCHVDGTYLVMQRAPGKNNAGKWELTAGGSAISGETPQQCVERELREETGIVAEPTELGRCKNEVTHAYYVEFACTVDVDKDSVCLQEGETSAYRWVTREELLALSDADMLTLRTKLFVAALRNGDK